MSIRRATLVALSCAILFNSIQARRLQSIESPVQYPKCNIAPAGTCVYDINQCGHSSNCQCPDGYKYDQRIGSCLLEDIEDRDHKAVIGRTETAGDVAQVMARWQDDKCVKLVEPGPCTMDINVCGHSSICKCPKGFEYDSRIGVCLVTVEEAGAEERLDENEKAEDVQQALDEPKDREDKDTGRSCAVAAVVIYVPGAVSKCTKDINECGFPTICQCPDGYKYDARLGPLAGCLLEDGSEGVTGTLEEKLAQDALEKLAVDGSTCAKPVPPGPCTMDSNTCGHSSRCTCPEGYEYNDRVALCLLATLANDADIGEEHQAPGADAKVIEQDTLDDVACAVAAVPVGIGKCSRDINECGHPTICQCPEGYQYDARLGPMAGCLLEEKEGHEAGKLIEIGTPAAKSAETELNIIFEKGSTCAKRVEEGPCTADLNMCGNSSSCRCTKGYTYDSRVNMCLKTSVRGKHEA